MEELEVSSGEDGKPATREPTIERTHSTPARILDVLKDSTTKWNLDSLDDSFETVVSKKNKSKSKAQQEKPVVSDSECPPLAAILFKPTKTVTTEKMKRTESMVSSASSSDKAPNKVVKAIAKPLFTWGSVSQAISTKGGNSPVPSSADSRSQLCPSPKSKKDDSKKAEGKAKAKKKAKAKSESPAPTTTSTPKKSEATPTKKTDNTTTNTSKQSNVSTPKNSNTKQKCLSIPTPKKSAKKVEQPSAKKGQNSNTTKNSKNEEDSEDSDSSDDSSSSDDDSPVDWRRAAAKRNNDAKVAQQSAEAKAGANAALEGLILKGEAPEAIAGAVKYFPHRPGSIQSPKPVLLSPKTSTGRSITKIYHTGSNILEAITRESPRKILEEKSTEKTPLQRADNSITGQSAQSREQDVDSMASTCSTAQTNNKGKHAMRFHDFTHKDTSVPMTMNVEKQRMVGMEIDQFDDCVANFEKNEVRPQAVQFIQDMCDFVFDTDTFFRRLFCEATKFWCPDEENVRPCICPYGSYATNLYLPQSDVDCVLCASTDGGVTLKPLLRNDELTRTLAQHFDVTWQEKNLGDDDNIRHKALLVRLKEWVSGQPLLVQAKIPLVQLHTQKLFDRHLTTIDLSILDADHTGVHTVEVLMKYQKEFPTLRPLVLVLKQMLYTRGLNVARSFGLPSYGLVLMVVAFLQTKGLHERYYSTYSKHEELGVQFMRLCQFYSGYSDNNTPAVPVQNGGRRPEDMVNVFDWQHMGLAPVMPGTPTESALIWMQYPQQIGTMCILDPLSHENNVARVTCRANELQFAFMHAWNVLSAPCLCCHDTDGPFS